MVNPDASALNLSRAIDLKQGSYQEVMQATLERTARLNPQSNAIVNLQEPELWMAQAKERDAQSDWALMKLAQACEMTNQDLIARQPSGI